MPAEAGESFEADELWLFIASKVQVLWLWLCVSYETGQVWAFHLGEYDGEAATALMEQFFARLPPELVHRLRIYTDGLPAYAPAIEEQLQERGRKAWSDRVHRARPKKARRIQARRRRAINTRRWARANLRCAILSSVPLAEGVNNGLRARCGWLRDDEPAHSHYNGKRGPRGYDGAKKVCGRKRVSLCDWSGNFLNANVLPANLDQWVCALLQMKKQPFWRQVQVVYANNDFAGESCHTTVLRHTTHLHWGRRVVPTHLLADQIRPILKVCQTNIPMTKGDDFYSFNFKIPK